MCDPLTLGIVAGTLAVGAAATSHIGTNRLYHANELAANFDFANQSNISGQAAGQLDQEKSEAAFDTALTTVQSEGEIAASASEQGLGRQSITQALNSNMFGIGRQASIADLNDRNARAQMANEGTGRQISRNSRIALQPKSGLANLTIGIGSGIMQGVNTTNSAKAAGR